MNLILNELRGLKFPDGTALEDVAVLSPNLINIDFDSEDGRSVLFDVVPINESFIRIEAQLITRQEQRLYRQVVALTNNPSYFIEIVKEFVKSSSVRKSKIRDANIEMEAKRIIVPSMIFDKWIVPLFNKGSIVVFDVSFIEDEEKPVIIGMNTEVLKEIMSLPPFDVLFRVLEDIIASTSNVKKRTVKAFKCGHGFCVAIGNVGKEGREYKRYRVPIKNEKKHIILLIPEECD